MLRDLAEVTHWVSMVKIAPEAADDPTVGPDERARGLDFAGRLPMRVLARTWQMLLKALEEVATAPNAMMAAEMAIIRLTHVAELPTPEDLVRRLSDAAPPPAAAGGRRRRRRRARRGGGVRGAGGRARRRRPAVASAEPGALARYARFEDVVALVRARRDVSLLVEIEHGVRLAKYAPGRIEFEPADGAAPDLAARLGAAAAALDRRALGRVGGRLRRGGDDRRGARGRARRPDRPVGGAPDGAGGARGLSGRRDPRGAAGRRARRDAGRAGAGGRRGRRLGSVRSRFERSRGC